MMVPFGEWMPDQPGASGALVDAKNVTPQAVGYGPIMTPQDWSGSASENLNNIVSARTPTEAVKLFAGGASKLFLLNGNDLTFSNVSKTGGYSTPSGQRWNFTQFGNRLIAANGYDRLQGYLMGTSTLFADLGAAAPKSRYVAVVRDFVVAGYNNGATVYPNRVEWSALGDETDWTASALTQSDYQDIPDGGHVKGVTGGEYGLVFLDRAVVRMSYVGSPLVFQFDTISRGQGCLEANSIVQYAGITYFLSDDGFYMCDGQSIKSISVEKIDRWFFNDADVSQLSLMSAAVDPLKNLVIWSYRSVDAVQRLLIYNFNIGKWSYGEADFDFVAQSTTISTTTSAGLSLEDLDVYGSLDDLPASLDSYAFTTQGTYLTGGNNAKIIAFSGTPLTPNIITPDLSLDGKPSVLTLVRPVIDGGSCSVKIRSRRLLSEQTDFTGSTYSANSDNRISARSAGNYHRLQVTPTGNFWTTAIGVDVTLVPQGVR